MSKVCTRQNSECAEGFGVSDFVRAKVNLLDNGSRNSQHLLANLFRAIGKHPGAIPEVFPVTLEGLNGEWLGVDGNPSTEEWAIHTALSLYGLHRHLKSASMNCPNVSFGTAVGRLAKKNGHSFNIIHKRFSTAITTHDISRFAYHAVALIKQLSAAGIAFDYSLFAKQLLDFQERECKQDIQLSWSIEFHRAAGVS